jgi:geranylgeranyl pyrophosphate synthase
MTTPVSTLERGPAAAPADLGQSLAAYRARVAPVMRGAIPDREPKRHLYDLVTSMIEREGKGIRPALCLATCGAFGGDAERALPSAAAIELLHDAFLVHDDIEDGSEYRRDRPTLHRQYGVPLAVNVGDAMNAMSVRLLRENLSLLGPALGARIFDEFDHMSIETIEGQAMELGWIGDNDCAVSEEDYLLMVLKKTGWYSFIHPMRIGALVADPGRGDLDVFNRLGYYLGAAFQIQDDVLNLVGDRRKYGKEIGGDLLEGKRTLILAHLFRTVSGPDRLKVKEFLGKPRGHRMPREVGWMYDLLRHHGSIEYARAAGQKLAASARDELEQAFAGARSGGDRDFVRSLVDHVVSRDF